MKKIFPIVCFVKEEIRKSHRKETKIDVCIILKVCKDILKEDNEYEEISIVFDYCTFLSYIWVAEICMEKRLIEYLY